MMDNRRSGVLWLALALMSLIGCAAPHPARPLSMTIEAPAEAIRGETLRGAIHLRNDSPEPVAVDALSSTCGCATFEFVPETLLPGAARETTISIDASNFEGPTSMSVRAFSGSEIVGVASHAVRVRQPFPPEAPRTDPIELSLPPSYLDEISEIAVYPFATARTPLPATVNRAAGTITFRAPRGSGEIEIVLRRSPNPADATAQRIAVTDPPGAAETPSKETELLPTLGAEHQAAALEREATWDREAGLTPIEHLTLEQLVDEIIRSIQEEGTDLSPDQRAAFSSRVAGRLLAMSSPTIDDYLDYIDGQYAYRPTMRDNDAFGKIAAIYEYEFGKPPRERVEGDVYRDLWSRLRSDKGFRIAELGTGPRGVRTAVFTVRTPQDVGVRGPEALRDADYWLGMPMTFSAMAFHQPKRSLEYQLSAKSVATVAAVHTIVRLENGTPACLIILWRLDEMQNDWVCDKLLGKSARLLRLIR